MAFQSPYPAAKSNTSTSPPKIAATQFTREYLSSTVSHETFLAFSEIRTTLHKQQGPDAVGVLSLVKDET